MIRNAETSDDILKCFEVMKELRPHHTEASFAAAMQQMIKEGYRMLFLEVDGNPVCVAGFRFTTTFYDGLIIDFDDFVTARQWRGKGYAGQVFDHLLEIARERSIKTIHLNSNHQRFDAHRFYLNKGMRIVAHHFRLEV
jgi:GNAT superfamily N-acetyltransferase